MFVCAPLNHLKKGFSRVVEDLVPLAVPLELLGLGGPEALEVLGRAPGERVPVLHARLRDDLRRRVEDLAFELGGLLGSFMRARPLVAGAASRRARAPDGRDGRRLTVRQRATGTSNLDLL